jgi:exonuclease SbcC
MKLRSLSMHLFRQHVNTTIHFPDGLVGIIGTNGSGKTTILEAIGFALFGSKALRGRVEDVRTRTAPAKSGRGKREQDMRVELILEHDETVFRIERSLVDAALYVGGQATAVASGNREVSARIGAIVGMSHDEFIATYCTEQKGLEFLSGKKGATEREKFIIRMMGYHRLEELQELLRSDRRDMRSVLQGYEASVGTREELEGRLTSETEQLRHVQGKHAEAVQALLKVEGEFGSVHERMQRLEDQRTRFLKERDGVQALQVRVEERAKRQRAIADSIVLAEDELVRALKPLIGTRPLQEVLSETKREILVQREQAEALILDLQRSEVTWREEISGLNAERGMLTRQAEQLSKKIEKMGSLDSQGECPTCNQTLGASFKDASAHLADELRRIRGQIAEVAERERAIETPPNTIEVQRKKHQALTQNIEKLSVKQQELLKCQQLEERIVSLRNEQRLNDADIQSATESLERAQVRLADIKFSEDEYLREKGAHDASQRLLEIARLQRVRLEGELKTHEALVSRSKEDLVKFDDRMAELEKLRREVRIFDECDRIVTDFRKFVNSSIRPRMAELASEYLTDLTDGRYSAVELEEDFTPTVVEDGEPKRVISGGEEDILNLCMRISLSHMLAERAGQNFSLLMLDEVFGSLDEGRRGNVLALLEKLRRRFEQIVIITHLDDIKDGVQHLIQVEYDEGSGSASVVNAAEASFEFDLALNV